MTPTQTLLAQIRKPEFLEAVRGAVPHLVPNGELSLASAVLVAICTKMDTWPPTGNEAARRASEDAQLWFDIREAILRAEMPLPKVKANILPESEKDVQQYALAEERLQATDGFKDLPHPPTAPPPESDSWVPPNARARYGVYSHQQAYSFGSFFYSQGDGEVEVSEVGLDPECSGCSWPDKALVGEVGKFLRKGRPGILTTPPIPPPPLIPPFPPTTPPIFP